MKNDRFHSWKLFFSILLIILGFWGLLLGLIPTAHAATEYPEFPNEDYYSIVYTRDCGTVVLYQFSNCPVCIHGVDYGGSSTFTFDKETVFYRFDLIDSVWSQEEHFTVSLYQGKYEIQDFNFVLETVEYSDFDILEYGTNEIVYSNSNSGDNTTPEETTPTDPTDSTDPTDPSEDDNSGNLGADDSGGIGGEGTEEDDSQGIIDSITSFFEEFFTNLFKPFIELYDLFIGFFSNLESIGEWWESLGEYVDLENPLKPLYEFFDSLDSGVFSLIADLWTWPIIGELLTAFVLVLVIGGIILLFVTL